LYCSSRRAVEELGYEVRPLAELLDDCYRWMRASGKLRT
jgi:nucleoside-diphosphate-sugar epimerase